MENRDQITYKVLYDLVDEKTDKLNKKIDSLQIQVAGINAQAKMIPFLVSTGVGIFFTIISFVITFTSK